MALAQRQRLKGLYRRGGVWWYRYTATPGGPQLRESLKTSDEGEATSAALEIGRRAPLKGADAFAVEMERYFKAQLESGRLSPFTVSVRRYAIQTYAKDCSVDSVMEVSPESVQRWLALLRGRNFAPSSLAAYYMHLRAFCTWLVFCHKLRQNPCARVKLGKLSLRARKNFLTKDQIRTLIANAPSDELRFIFFCGFHAGMRSNEIVEARPDWFRLSSGAKRGCISIGATPTFRPKDKEERTVPLTAEFETFLRGYLPTLPNGALWVFRPLLKKKPGLLRRTSFRHGFVLYMASQGVRCSPHDMRRSFVSNKLADDSSLIFKLARWTGTDVRTLQKHYAHLLADDSDIEAGV